MADTPNQQPTGFDPIAEVQKSYDVGGASEPQLYQKLRVPANFRQAFPDKAHASDDEITSNVDRIYNTHYAPKYSPAASGPAPVDKPDFTPDTSGGFWKSL